ncbi:hypothetical protein AB0H83_34925 [Dactylosporangium sp. NPDC050688]|uniref:hypothetical protein n=1 Tax=Dactylosporangium sp. NPDC050688 TaxID=3157217 RepID=UPI0033D9EE82
MAGQFATALFDQEQVAAIAARSVIECEIEPLEAKVCAVVVYRQPSGRRDEAHGRGHRIAVDETG